MADLLVQRYFPELEPGIRTDEFRQQASKTRDKYSPTDGKPKKNTWSHKEIWEELQRGRRKTSPGPDDISYQAIRACADILTPWLTAIYNAVIDTGHVPRQRKVGKVCNITKPGKSGEEAKHYRPISLLSCVSKIFEALVTKKISTWAEDKGVLPDSQYGFRKNRTTGMPLGNPKKDRIPNRNHSCVHLEDPAREDLCCQQDPKRQLGLHQSHQTARQHPYLTFSSFHWVK